MTDERKNHEELPLNYERGGIPIGLTPAEREKADRDREKADEREYKQEQASIQRGIYRTQIGLVIFGIFGAGISAFQAWNAKISADASKKASEEATAQVWQAVGNINWLARSADWSQKVSKVASDSSSAQANESLQATITQFRQQQRPYVWHSIMGSSNRLADFYQETDVHWINYGHSPAINFNPRGKVFCGENALKDGYAFLEAEEAKMDFPKSGSVIAPAVLSDPPSQNPNISEPLNPAVPYDSFRSDLMLPLDGEKCRTNGPRVTVVYMTYFDVFGNSYWGELCNGFRFHTQRSYLASGSCMLHNRM